MQIELIGALNDTNALHGLFIDATARRLSSIAEEAERVGREKEMQSLKLKEHARRVKSANAWLWRTNRISSGRRRASSFSTSSNNS